MSKLNNNVFSCTIILVLSVLIIVRLSAGDENSKWINIVNYTGLLTAIFSLFFGIHSKYKERKKVILIVGTFVVLLAPLVTIGVLIFADVIIPTTKANDVIMLITLLISLPTQFYIELMDKYMRE